MVELSCSRGATFQWKWTLITALGAMLLFLLVPPASGQTADPFTIRVETHLVLVPTFVYEKDRMTYISPTESKCTENGTQSFFKLRLSEPLPEECDEKVAVFAHTSYCNNKQPASDPLRGTKFGEQLKRDFALSKAGKMELSVQAGSLYSSGQDARVVLALEIPWKSLWRTWQNGTFSATIGILGLVYDKDGALAGRFSDLACCLSGLPKFIKSRHRDEGETPHPEFDPASLPVRYQTQVELPPGEYNLHLVLSDNTKFGRVDVPLQIDAYDEKRLGLSSLLLCKRFRDGRGYCFCEE
jgi:hypothetical protein